MNATYSEHSHKTCSTDSHSHSQRKTSFTAVSSTMSTYSSSFRPWVPDLNLNKSLESILETPCKYFLHSKFSFNSLCTLNLLFLHIPKRLSNNFVLIYEIYLEFRIDACAQNITKLFLNLIIMSLY